MRATFITLAAYDWRMLPASIASYYDYADEIIVGLDRQRMSWSGVPFELGDNELRRALWPYRSKVRLVEDDFFFSQRTPMQNDCAEREHLASLARNEWTVEVDADEVIIDVPALFATMDTCPVGHQVLAEWTQVYKVIDGTALVVTPSLQLAALATRSRTRKLARQTGEPPVIAPMEVLHMTTARTEAELKQKLTSWSHSTQVRPDFLDQWRSVTFENHHAARNLHPFKPAQWPHLRAVPLESLCSR